MHHFYLLIKSTDWSKPQEDYMAQFISIIMSSCKEVTGVLFGFLPLNSSTVCLEEKVELMKGVVDFTASSTGFMSKMSRWGGEPTQPFEDEKGPFRCRSEGKNTEYR